MSKISSCASCARKLLTYEQSFSKKALFSGIELICGFLRTMLNLEQFLLSIVSYFFSSCLASVCRKYNFERKM